jgi:hypothetical protein
LVNLNDLDGSDDDDTDDARLYNHTRHEIKRDEQPVVYQFSDSRLSSFLQKISQEDVRYETDSEAADSWAPSDPGKNKTTTTTELSTTPSTTCDPARIAFLEIMNRHSELALEMELETLKAADSFPPPPPPVPSNSPEEWTNKLSSGLSNSLRLH